MQLSLTWFSYICFFFIEILTYTNYTYILNNVIFGNDVSLLSEIMQLNFIEFSQSVLAMCINYHCDHDFQYLHCFISTFFIENLLCETNKIKINFINRSFEHTNKINVQYNTIRIRYILKLIRFGSSQKACMAL